MFAKKADSATKKKILQAITNSNNNQFAKIFSDNDYVHLPHSNAPFWGRTYWTSHIRDITVLVLKRGKEVNDWHIQFQCW